DPPPLEGNPGPTWRPSASGPHNRPHHVRRDRRGGGAGRRPSAGRLRPWLVPPPGRGPADTPPDRSHRLRDHPPHNPRRGCPKNARTASSTGTPKASRAAASRINGAKTSPRRKEIPTAALKASCPRPRKTPP